VTSPSPSPATEVLDAARAGARSLNVRGWYAEECESAALEGLARRPCLDVGLAYMRGRSAALDELRRLTGWRRDVRARTFCVSWDDDPHPSHEDEPDDDSVDLERLCARLTSRERQVVELVAAGLNGRQIADELGLDPSRVTTLKRGAARKIDRRMLRAS
jgi:DNA-binding NarL/FixJ family response regulator